MQLLGDGYEIPEMTKLHCLLRPSRFTQRCPLRRFWDTGGAWPTQASVSSKSTHKSPLRQTRIGACRLARVGWRTCTACRLAHICGLWASAHVRHGASCDRKAAMPIRCLIVDDNSSFRQVMGGLLEEQGLEVVGGAASAAEALQQIAELRPDVALIDIDLGRDSGLTLAARLRETPGPAVPIVILISTHDGGAFAELIERSSALGFLPKTELSGAAIRRMLAPSTSETSRSGERRGT